MTSDGDKKKAKKKKNKKEELEYDVHYSACVEIENEIPSDKFTVDSFYLYSSDGK